MLKIPYDGVSAILNHSYPSRIKFFSFRSESSEPSEVVELRKFLSDNKNLKTEFINGEKIKLVQVEKLLNLVLTHLPTVMAYEDANPVKQLYVNLYYYLIFSSPERANVESLLNLNDELLELIKLEAARIVCRAIDTLKKHHLYSPVVKDLFVKHILKGVANFVVLRENLNQLEVNGVFTDPDNLWDYASLYDEDELLFEILQARAIFNGQKENIDQPLKNINAFSKAYYKHPNILIKSYITETNPRNVRDITQVLRRMLRAEILGPKNLKKIFSIFNINLHATPADVEKFVKFSNSIYYYITNTSPMTISNDSFYSWLQLVEAGIIPTHDGQDYGEVGELTAFGKSYPVLKDYIPAIIANREDIFPILRLLRLLSITQVPVTAENIHTMLQNRAYLVGNEFFDRVPAHMVTPQVFARLIQICQSDNTTDNKRQEIAAYGTDMIMNYAAGMNQPRLQQPVQGLEPQAQDINSRQSTHDKEVHKTVSESVKRLHARYGDRIKTPQQLDQVIESIKKWAQQLPDEPKEPDARFETPINIDEISPEFKAATAKRAIFKKEPKIGVLDLNFMDPGSNITMRQMFALYWIAAHDFDSLNKERVGGHDYQAADTERFFINGLYEIQREYCIDKIDKQDETEYDFGDADRNSCAGGTFNKMSEKFKSVHPDVEVKVSSARVLTFKFPIIVREAMLDYLKQKLEGIQDINALNDVKSLFDKVNDEGAGAIWDEIHVIVHKSMASEFADVFATPKELEDYVENGRYTELTETQKQAFQKHLKTYDSKFSNSNDSAPIETPVELPSPKAEPIPAPQVEPDITLQEEPIKALEKEPIPSKSSNTLKRSNSFFAPLETQTREISQSEKLEKIQRMKDVLDYVINDATSRMIEVEELDAIKKEHASILKTTFALLADMKGSNEGEVNHLYNLTNHMEDNVIGKDLYDQLNFSLPRSKPVGFKK